MKIWALEDFKIGSSKQTEFLANSLSDDVVVKNIEYTKYIKIPNVIKPFKVGINFEESDDLINSPDCPDIIVFSGRRLAGLAIYLKKYFHKYRNKTIKLISILNPDYSFKYFDFVLLPSHDKLKDDKYNNVIIFDGALCKNDLDNKEHSIDFWTKQLFNNYKTPFYTLIIGGNIKGKIFNVNKFKLILRLLSNFVKQNNGTLLISTSRRTPEGCINMLNNNNIYCDYYLYKWGKSGILNPYYAFINFSDVVFLTADSISMISEITTIGKPVYVYKQDESISDKHKNFFMSMLGKGIIREIRETDSINKIEPFSFNKINELERVKNKILEDLNI